MDGALSFILSSHDGKTLYITDKGVQRLLALDAISFKY